MGWHLANAHSTCCNCHIVTFPITFITVISMQLELETPLVRRNHENNFLRSARRIAPGLCLLSEPMDFLNGGHLSFHISCHGKLVNGKGSFLLHSIALLILPGRCQHGGGYLGLCYLWLGGWRQERQESRGQRAENPETAGQRPILTRNHQPSEEPCTAQEEKVSPQVSVRISRVSMMEKHLEFCAIPVSQFPLTSDINSQETLLRPR